MKKTILISTAIYPPDIGGPATFIEKLEKRLIENGYKVTIVALTDNKNSIIVKKSNIEQIFIPRNSNYIFRTLRIVITLIIKGRKADLLFVNGLFIESAVSLFFTHKLAIGKFVGDPIWERYRNKNKTEYKIEEFFNSKSSIIKKVMIRLYKKCFEKLHTIIFPSHYLMAFFSDIYVTHNKKNVIYNSIATPENQNSNKIFSKQWDVIILSRLVKWKNIDLVFENMVNSNCEIIVVGDGPEMNYLKNSSKKNKLNVFYSGGVSNAESLKYLKKSKIFVQVSSYEGFSHSLLEAMSLGLVCVVSDIPAHREIIEHNVNGIIIKSEEFVDLNFKIQGILKNQNLYDQISARAIETIKKRFTDEVSLNKYLEIFNKL